MTFLLVSKLNQVFGGPPNHETGWRMAGSPSMAKSPSHSKNMGEEEEEMEEQQQD